MKTFLKNVKVVSSIIGTMALASFSSNSWGEISPYCEVTKLKSIAPITYVEFAEMANKSSSTIDGKGVYAHEDYTDEVAYVNKGKYYTLYVDGNTGKGSASKFTAFFDWNQDGDFEDPGEMYYLGYIKDTEGTSGEFLKTEIKIPSYAENGKTRMRIVKYDYEGAITVPDGCSVPTSIGQVEDYTVAVEEGECGDIIMNTEYVGVECKDGTYYIYFDFSKTSDYKGWYLKDGAGDGFEVTKDKREYKAGPYNLGEDYTAYLFNEAWGDDCMFEIPIFYACGEDEGVENDDCKSAISLTVNKGTDCTYKTTGTTVDATESSETTSSCNGKGVDDDVWYVFEATGSSHNVTLSDVKYTTTISTKGSPANVGVYSGSCGKLTELSCGTLATLSSKTLELTGLTKGEKYYVRVWTSTTERMSTFTLCVTTPVTAPANDECKGAVALKVNEGEDCKLVTVGTTIDATGSSESTSCAKDGAIVDDVWFKFEATGSSHDISLSDISYVTLSKGSFMHFSVYSGECGKLTEIDCSTIAELSLTSLTKGSTYYVRAWTVGSSRVKSFNVCVTTPATPPINDDCKGAVALKVNKDATKALFTSGTTKAATASKEVDPSCESKGVADDVWFTFEATSTDHILSVEPVAGTSKNVNVEVYSGECGKLSSVICSDKKYQLITDLKEKTTYYVRVWTKETDDSYLDFNIAVSTPIQGSSCNNPLVVKELTYKHTTESNIYGNAYYNGAPGADCSKLEYLNGNDVVYSYTPTENGSINVIMSDLSIAGAGVSVYTSCKDIGSKCIAGAYNEKGKESFSIEKLSVNKGTTYYFVVSSLGDFSSLKYSIEIKNTPCEAPKIVADKSEVCKGTKVKLSASSGTKITSFEWFADDKGTKSLGKGETYTTDGLTESITIYGKATYEFCSSEFIPVKITVNETPVVTAKEVSICGEGSTTITPDVSVKGSDVLWYDSEKATEPIHKGASFTTPSLKDSKTYYVEASNKGCISTRIAVKVVINKIPDVKADNVEVCFGTKPTFKATSSDSKATFKWFDVATGGTALSTDATFEAAAVTGTKDYYVSATVNGCESPRTKVSVTITNTAFEFDKFGDICDSGSIKFTVTSAVEKSTINWYSDESLSTLINTGNTYTTPILKETKYYYVTNTVGKCVSSKTMVAAVVNQLPFEITDGEICGEGIVEMSAKKSESATGVLSYFQWAEDEGFSEVLHTGPNYITAPLLESTKYYVRILSDKGCTTAPKEANAYVRPIPEVALVNDFFQICYNDSAKMEVVAEDGVVYTWYDGSEGVVKYTKDEGTYKVIGMNEYGCTKENSVKVEKIQALKTKGFSYITNIAGTPLKVKFTPIEPRTDVEYLWDFGDGNTGEGVEVEHEYSRRGTYTVTMTVKNDCESLPATLKVSVSNSGGSTSIDNHNNPLGIEVYPNPTESVLNISLKNQGSINEVVIYNTVGQLVYQSAISNNNIIIDSKDWNAGWYHVVVKSNNNQDYSFNIIKK